MPLFELQSEDGRRFQVEAANANDAASAFDDFMAVRQPEGLVAKAGRVLKEAWDKPPEGLSIIGMLKGPVEALRTPLPPPGLRREDFTDIPPPTEHGPGTVPGVFGNTMFRPRAWQPSDPVIEAAGKLGALTMTGGIPFGGAPAGSLGVGLARHGAPRLGAAVPETPAPAIGPRQQTVEAAQRLGVEVPSYMVDENRMTQGLAAGLRNVPGAGDRIAGAAEATQRGLGAAASRAQEGFGSGSPAIAGGAAKQAIEDWIGPGSQKIASRVYDAVDNFIDNSITTELTATARVAQDILGRRAISRIPGQSAAVNVVADAISQPMTYQGIKGLRSFLGEMTPQEIASSGLRSAEVKQLYSALSEDLRSSVMNAGGQRALAAFNRANRLFSDISARRQALSKIIGTKGDAAPEAVFARILAMAGSRSTADASRLSQARRAIGPEAWNEVASAVVAKLGRDPQGEFSLKRFLGPNGYSGLTDAGKTALFRSTGKDNLARSLDDIAFVTKQIEEELEQFANPSGTGRSVTATGVVLGIYAEPISTLSALIGGNALAKVLSQPATAQATASWLKAYRDAITVPHVGSSKAVRAAAEKLAQLIVRDTGGNPNILAAQLQLGTAEMNQP
jgi:hypothetical protein